MRFSALLLGLTAVASTSLASPAKSRLQGLNTEPAPLYASPGSNSNNYMVVMDPFTSDETLNEYFQFINKMIVTSAEMRAEERANLKDLSMTDIFYEIIEGRPLDLMRAFADDDESYGFGHVYNIGKAKGNSFGSSGSLFKGFSGRFDEETLKFIRSLPDVKYVEMDHQAHISEVEVGAPWGLARISHKKPLSFSTFNRYDYNNHGGQGVVAYVIDTGVNVDHSEFEGRAKWGKTVPVGDTDTDAHGHGTHVAGTIASKTYGVAKLAHIIAVKVLGSNGSGSMSDVVAGVVWAAEDAAKKVASKKYKGAVANMSLGGGYSRALNEAVDAAIEAGLFFAVAAGNDNQDACSYSPASAEKAYTVAASTISDERAYFSNYGSCVDVFAPGLNILSTWNVGTDSVATLSGTSMASPHVAGIAAYFLSLAGSPSAVKGKTQMLTPVESFVSRCHSVLRGFFFTETLTSDDDSGPVLSPKELAKQITNYSSRNLIDNPGTGTPDLLINNHYTASK